MTRCTEARPPSGGDGRARPRATGARALPGEPRQAAQAAWSCRRRCGRTMPSTRPGATAEVESPSSTGGRRPEGHGQARRLSGRAAVGPSAVAASVAGAGLPSAEAVGCNRGAGGHLLLPSPPPSRPARRPRRARAARGSAPKAAAVPVAGNGAIFHEHHPIGYVRAATTGGARTRSTVLPWPPSAPPPPRRGASWRARPGRPSARPARTPPARMAKAEAMATACFWPPESSSMPRSSKSGVSPSARGRLGHHALDNLCRGEGPGSRSRRRSRRPRPGSRTGCGGSGTPNPRARPARRESRRPPPFRSTITRPFTSPA